MCERILYRRNGDLFTCIRVTPGGEEEPLGTGTRDEIVSWLASHGYGQVRPEVLAEDIEELCGDDS